MNGGREEVQPTFVKKENEFTTLNLKEVEEVLSKNNVSKQLLDKYRNQWSDCLSNLSKLSFKEFQAIDDISDIEDLMCDVQSDFWLANSFESHREFIIENGEYINPNKYGADITIHSAALKFHVIVVKQDDQWLINEIR
ncbi:hypothetical protein MY04_4484 [Flammeovirga sp. MY04]|uniref:hypothetical protein n=1 Tax=Flammeovirga sp. MY04 TaxID=1191459 RepID=UPI000806278D|nr:hypothetical protein [Flammeovirga sp. MY04]ANQ51820.1 hypothetical protein MY04_4484 [Flammeovirga sp. MY04]